jgi:hypothetical protein
MRKFHIRIVLGNVVDKCRIGEERCGGRVIGFTEWGEHHARSWPQADGLSHQEDDLL